MGIRNHRKENCARHMTPSPLAPEASDDIIQPRRVTNPVQESPTHRSLHRELLFSHRRGLLLGGKPELQRVLQQRRLEQDVPPPSDLEQELRKRKQRLQEYEQEELKRKEGQENVPEFVRVKENLRHVRVAVQ
ncbi:protein FAM107B-like isoform X2 [Anguilla anguilla]|nr:protein FAM107B-like isoform X2 [Anguilla anguilla]XP_035244729.1 protein FAM107B-like isoform X2 [Anguilla anguilla]